MHVSCRTYTPDYAASVTAAAPGGGACPSFEGTSKRFDRELLLERAPILFTAEVPLYESEMDDSGVASCSVRVRLLPMAPA
jgi:hypothetical protein